MDGDPSAGLMEERPDLFPTARTLLRTGCIALTHPTGDLPSSAPIDVFRMHVPVVDVRVGKELSMDLLERDLAA